MRGAPFCAAAFCAFGRATGRGAVRKRGDVVPAVQMARAARETVLSDFQVEQEDPVYPMVPAGAALDQMIRRPNPIAETGADV